MLTNLYIENIAVIEKSRIDFTGGLNVLTGETGAGKSIVIDSINAVLGHRSSRGMIRSGADAAFVSATFEGLSGLTLKKLRAMGYEAEDDTLILSQLPSGYRSGASGAGRIPHQHPRAER